MVRKRTALEIDAEIAKLQRGREETRVAEKAGVIARMKEAIAYYGITAADLGLDGLSRNAYGTAKRLRPEVGRVKYKDDAGHTWSGFGRKPKWFVEALANGKAEADLRVA